MSGSAESRVDVVVVGSLTRDRIEETYPRLLARSGERVNGLLEDARIEVEAVARERRLRSAAAARALSVERRQGSPQDLADALASALTRSSDFTALVVVDRNGTAVASAGASDSLDRLLAELGPMDVLESSQLAVDERMEIRVQLGGASASLIRLRFSNECGSSGHPELSLMSFNFRMRAIPFMAGA